MSSPERSAGESIDLECSISAATAPRAGRRVHPAALCGGRRAPGLRGGAARRRRQHAGRGQGAPAPFPAPPRRLAACPKSLWPLRRAMAPARARALLAPRLQFRATPLHVAAARGHVGPLEALISAGAELDSKTPARAHRPSRRRLASFLQAQSPDGRASLRLHARTVDRRAARRRCTKRRGPTRLSALPRWRRPAPTWQRKTTCVAARCAQLCAVRKT